MTNPIHTGVDGNTSVTGTLGTGGGGTLDPDKVRQGVEQIGEALKGKDPKAAAKEVGNVLRNLLGGR